MLNLKINQYKKNILQLFTGTAIAQAIPLLSSPILTRIYTPEEFGLYAIFLAFSALFTILTTLRLEMAIVLPDFDTESKNLTTIAITISVIITAIFTALIYTLYHIFSLSFQLENLVLLLPFSIAAHSFYTILYYYSLRNKKFKLLAKTRILIATLTLVLSLVFPWIGLSKSGLILASIISYMISIPILIYQNKYRYGILNRTIIKNLLLKYSSFPKLDLPTALMIQISNRLPVLLFSTNFSDKLIGNYSLSQRMIDTPTSFITSAISDSFKQKATYDYNKTGTFINVFKETRMLLIIVSIIPYVAIQFFAVEIFSFSFGNEWEIAGVYAQILAPLFLVRFIVSPLTYTLYIYDKLNYNLFGQFAKLVLSAIALILGIYFDNIKLGLILFVIFNSIIYLFYYIISLKYASLNKI